MRNCRRRCCPLFHYALNPAGFLLLGFSETVGPFVDLFDAEDRKLKLFRRREHTMGARQPAMLSFVPAPNTRSAHIPSVTGRLAAPEKMPWREVIERALLQNLVLAWPPW
jgi:two-component system CheB/CheR fusion protein